MIEIRAMEVKPKDLYQFLIAECRYGYTRNNHLMPGGAYEHAKTYLKELLNVDARLAVLTAKQLCEECIEFELEHFADGIDDAHGNRKAALEFIENMKAFVNAQFEEAGWKPYNYDKYENNVAFDSMPRYEIYEAEYTGYNKLADEYEFTVGKKLSEQLVSKNNLIDAIWNILEIKSNNGYFRKYDYKPMFDEKQILTKYVFDDIKKAVLVKRGDC